MEDRRSKAKEYRRQAAACLQVAERMSLRDDRALMLEMAKHWLELARTAEDEMAADIKPTCAFNSADFE